MIDPKDADALVSLVTNGVFAAFGALANYLYSITTHNRPMSWTAFFVNITLGFFVGNVVGSFLPSDFLYRDGTLLISGFVCYRILAMIERAGPEAILNIILGALGRLSATPPAPAPPPALPAPPEVPQIESKDDEK